LASIAVVCALVVGFASARLLVRANLRAAWLLDALVMLPLASVTAPTVSEKVASAKVPPEFIYKVIDTMEKHRGELAKIAPVLGEITAATAYRQYGIPYHAGAVNYYKAHNIQVKPLPQ
jgi:hypothetical protein